jgi:tetratricopeptide (TPR) repeat protein
VTSETSELIQQYYQSGKDAFERGHYRQAIETLEKACSLVNRSSALGGEIQMWLLTAYQAAGKLEEAIALCQTVSRHPDPTTAKQGRRLLYILKAPRLKMRPEWITPIPDLAALEDNPTAQTGLSEYRTKIKPRRKRSKPQEEDLEPIDWSQINTRDNQFVWVALGAIALTLGGLAFFI